MTDKELRKLNRAELIEILLEQSKHVENLEKKLKEAEDKLNNREIILSESGSIAEAALRLNHIFEDAQAAGEQYIQGLKALFVREHGGDVSIIEKYESQQRKTAEENNENSDAPDG